MSARLVFEKLVRYSDEFNREVLDVTEEYNQRFGTNALRVERCQQNVLRLERDDTDGEGEPLPKSRFGYVLLYQWLASNDADLNRVQGEEMQRYNGDELDPSQPLFRQFRLFP